MLTALPSSHAHPIAFCLLRVARVRSLCNRSCCRACFQQRVDDLHNGKCACVSNPHLPDPPSPVGSVFPSRSLCSELKPRDATCSLVSANLIFPCVRAERARRRTSASCARAHHLPRVGQLLHRLGRRASSSTRACWFFDEYEFIIAGDAHAERSRQHRPRRCARLFNPFPPLLIAHYQ